MMAARKAGDNITVVRNPNYYRPAEGMPYLDKMIFKIIPDQVALTNALRAHEVDCAWFLDIAQINTYQHITGYTLIASTAPNFEQGCSTCKNPILQDVRVRQALEYGLDRYAMVKDVWHGTALPLGSDVAADVVRLLAARQAVSLRSGQGGATAGRGGLEAGRRTGGATRTARC